MPGDMENVCLRHDNGEDLRFQGRLFSECSHFDEEDGSLTRQQLYVAENGEQVYYIVRSDGQERSRRAYRLAVRGEICVIDNGNAEISLRLDMLMLAIRALCGMSEDSELSLESLEEVLQAVNG